MLSRKNKCESFLYHILVCIILFTSNISYATTQRDSQFWSNVIITGYLDKKPKALSSFKFWIENQERVGDDFSRLSQALWRGALGYTIKPNISLWLGYAWIDTGIPFTYKPFIEDRIWQQLIWAPKVKEWNLTERIRTEQRFLANNDKVAYRIRFLTKVARPFTAFPKWSFVSSDELFWHKNDFIGRNGKGFDQNRFFIGLGYKLYPKATLEMGYTNQYIRRFGVPNFQNNIAVVTLLVNL